MTSWRSQAACKDKPMDWFFPPPGGRGKNQVLGLTTCASCPVRAECLAEALSIEGPRMVVRGGCAQGVPVGIFGGKLPRERVEMVLAGKYTRVR